MRAVCVTVKMVGMKDNSASPLATKIPIVKATIIQSQSHIVGCLQLHLVQVNVRIKSNSTGKSEVLKLRARMNGYVQSN